VALVALLDAGVVLLAVLLYRNLESISFDEEFSSVVGLPVDALLLLLLAVIALSVVTLIQVVGIILAIALLTIPAETARPWAASLRGMMLIAGTASAASTTAGILASYGLSEAFALSVPSGPLVILISVALYGASHVLRRLVPMLAD
jgi:zinc transport system permease protein